MDSAHLTREQREAIQAKLREHQRYYRRLLVRMNARRFPADDPLRVQVQAMHDRLSDLWMHMHYQGCRDKVGG